MDVCSNGRGHMTKIATTLMIGKKHLKFFCSSTRRLMRFLSLTYFLDIRTLFPKPTVYVNAHEKYPFSVLSGLYYTERNF